MAKKVYDEDGLDMQKTDWSGDESTGNLPVSGRLVENYIKSIDDKATPTEELAAGETKAPTSGAVFASLVGTVTNIDVTDSEDGTQYVMTVTQKDGEGGFAPGVEQQASHQRRGVPPCLRDEIVQKDERGQKTVDEN